MVNNFFEFNFWLKYLYKLCVIFVVIVVFEFNLWLIGIFEIIWIVMYLFFLILFKIFIINVLIFVKKLGILFKLFEKNVEENLVFVEFFIFVVIIVCVNGIEIVGFLYIIVCFLYNIILVVLMFVVNVC